MTKTIESHIVFLATGDLPTTAAFYEKTIGCFWIVGAVFACIPLFFSGVTAITRGNRGWPATSSAESTPLPPASNYILIPPLQNT